MSQPISAFVGRMRTLLDRITHARTAEDKQAAKDEMAELIKANARCERERQPRVWVDGKQKQVGDDD